MSEISREGIWTILDAENLGRFNWFEDRSPSADEVGIIEKDTKWGARWRVYSTDKSSYPQYDKWHENEEEALSDFLDMVRRNNLSWERHEEDAD